MVLSFHGQTTPWALGVRYIVVVRSSVVSQRTWRKELWPCRPPTDLWAGRESSERRWMRSVPASRYLSLQRTYVNANCELPICRSEESSMPEQRCTPPCMQLSCKCMHPASSICLQCPWVDQRGVICRDSYWKKTRRWLWTRHNKMAEIGEERGEKNEVLNCSTLISVYLVNGIEK